MVGPVCLSTQSWAIIAWGAHCNSKSRDFGVCFPLESFLARRGPSFSVFELELEQLNNPGRQHRRDSDGAAQSEGTHVDLIEIRGVFPCEVEACCQSLQLKNSVPWLGMRQSIASMAKLQQIVEAQLTLRSWWFSWQTRHRFTDFSTLEALHSSFVQNERADFTDPQRRADQGREDGRSPGSRFASNESPGVWSIAATVGHWGHLPSLGKSRSWSQTGFGQGENFATGLGLFVIF